MHQIRCLAAAGCLLLLAACDPAEQPNRDEHEQPAEPGPGASAEDAEADPLAGLAPGWNAIDGGGDTVCSDGSDYRFFVRPGAPDKLVVYFQGGGACWFGANCDPHLEPSYKQTVAADEMQRYRGIFELDNPENPFADHSFVVAPYCTGDVHLGDNVATYEAPAAEEHEAHEQTIHHKGIVNALAVLEWTYRHFDPADIFVTGSSAGAIPSPYYAWKIAEHYPDARIAQLGDGAGGYRRSGDTNMARMEQWGTMRHLEQYPEFADMPMSEFAYEDLYVAAAKRYPDITFAEYDAAEDQTQKRFLAMGGSDTTTLRDLLLANHADVRAEVDNFRTYIAGGDSHTILARPEFYTFQVNGRRVRDWVADLASYQNVEDVACDPCDVAEVLAEGGQ
jgi:hypothetical protein